ncbi:hypothetical protein ACLVWU_11535 [Bdellovibrio sp. HCB290]|uniref:hypothetical protein n=1 Tax=Bdellovibrio sp. HCB290 TaxID=3394356 RepID=UPI0039B4C1FB
MTMKTWGLLLQTIIVSFGLSGCGYALEEMGLFKTGEIVLKTPKVNEFSESLIDYYVVSQTSLKSCRDCHNSKAPILDTEEKVYQHREDIMATVESGDMPPVRKGYQPLTACELQILRAYFDNKTNQRPPQRVKEMSACTEGTTTPKPNPAPPQPTPPTTPPGAPPMPPAPPAPPAPPTPPGPPAPPGPPPAPPTTPVPNPPADQTPQPDLGQLELSFKNLRMAFFDAKCLNCHSSTVAKPKDPMLDSVANIVAAKDYADKHVTIPRNGAESLLYRITVPGLAEEIMPPARTKVQLTPAEADYLKRWIDAGLPE